MKFKMIHENYNVYDLQKSLDFYKEALGLEEKRRKESTDGSFIIVYVGNDETDFELELTWMRDMDRPYNLGDCEFHLAFSVPDFEGAHAKHKEMGCICFENEEMGIYFYPKIRMDTGWRILPEKIKRKTKIEYLYFC